MNNPKNSVILLLTLILIFPLILLSCNGEGDEAQAELDEYIEEFKDTLTPFELEHGIGPITERIEIDDEIDPDLSDKGQSIFVMKCEVCHDLDERKLGPALGDVIEKRSPEYIMNFILNPGENILNHPVGLDLLAEYHIEMPFSDVDKEEARAVYEFLRDYYESR